ncbi:hypothetical protein D3C73_786470 [compost metagenome]
MLGKSRVDQRKGHRLKAQVPGRVPRVFPGIGHGNDVEIRQVPPMAVADVRAPRWWRRLRRVAIEPQIDVEIIQLLGPEQSSQGLALYVTRIRVVEPLLQC